MSQSHIPQPDSQQEAPSEQYGSTEAAPTGQTVSGIGVPGPPPNEVPTHTLAFNSVDPVLYKQFIFNSAFVWSVNDPRGKLLWTMPIHPKAYNKITARLSTIYNTWGGGVDVNIKIAGTGFHAGALIFVRIPPNVDPKRMSGTYDFTAFEYIVIDPKQLEVATIHIGDQRQVNYHYQMHEEGAPASFSMGGTLACYVYMGLNTASTGTQQIEVIMTTRLAPDFGFSQLIMPSPEQDQDADFIPDGLSSVLNFASSLQRSSLNSNPVVTLTILPISTPSANMNIYNIEQLDGKPYNGSTYANYATATITVSTKERIECNEASANLGIFACTNIVLFNRTATNVDSAMYVTNGNIEYTFPSQIVKFTQASIDGWSVGDKLAIYPLLTGTGLRGSSKIFTPPVSESLIVFGNITGYSFQTRLMADYFCTRTASKFLEKDKCALFTLYDTQENLPLMFVKLYPEGFLTVLPSKDAVTFNLNRLELRYQSIISRTTVIPLNSDMSRNKLLLASVHKKTLRNEQRRIQSSPWLHSSELLEHLPELESTRGL